MSELVLLVWVDAILLVGGRREVEATRKIVQETFTIRDMGPISHFLGIKVERDQVRRTISINQEGYVNRIL